MKFNRIYCIPTNRDIFPSLKSYIKEVEFVYKKYGEKFPLLIIETSEGEIQDKNKASILKINSEYPEIDIIHFTLEKQKKLFNDLFVGNIEYLKEHFLEQKKDYGKAINKIFILAALFGVDTFHRRDSDTILVNDFDSHYCEEYPIEIEIEYIGRAVSSITGSKEDDNIPITVVGSNYHGEWNMDIKDIAGKDFSLVYKLYELLGFDSLVVKDICDDAFKFEDKIVSEALKLSLIRSVNDSENPDCGNMAMYRLFEIYPALDARNTLASDYFVMDLATAMKKPSLHHNRKVFHQYSSQRFVYENKLSYWEGILKFCDYFNSYNQIYDGNLEIKDITITELADVVFGFAKTDLRKRQKRLEKILEEILCNFNEDYNKLSSELYPHIPELLNEMNSEYKLHSEMISSWSSVIKRCKSLDWRDYI